MLDILERQLYDKDKKSWFDFWNADLIKDNSNCYSYAIGYPWTFLNIGAFMNPGFKKDPNTYDKKKTLKEFENALINDGLTFLSKDIKNVPILKTKDYYIVSIFITFVDFYGDFKEFYKEKPITERIIEDYHIIRQQNDRQWTERNGILGDTDFALLSKDNKYPICGGIDKKVSFFLGYYMVPKTGLKIGIPDQIYNLNNNGLLNNINRYDCLKIMSFLKDFDNFMMSNLNNFKSIINLYCSFCKEFASILVKNNGDGWRDDILIFLEKNHHKNQYC